MKNVLILLSLLLGCGLTTSLAQDTQKLEVSINSQNNEKWRNLTPVIANGSGDYLFVWMCSAKYGIATDRSAKVATVPLDEENITYEVFVRDQKTGALGHKAVNFSKSLKATGVVTYPNPSRDEVTVSLKDQKSGVLNEVQRITKADLYSEKTGGIVRSIPVTSNNVDELKVNVKDLPPGTYYVHLWVNDNIHSEAQRKEIRVLIGSR